MTNTTDTIEVLQEKLAQTQKKYLSTLMERNFLQRAVADLNFHNNAHDGILYTDKDNNVVYANLYFLQMMGIEDPDTILGKPLPDYMWTDPSQNTQLFEDLYQDGFVRERELFLKTQDNKPVFAMCSSVVSKDDEGHIIGTEIMLCNVTTKRQVETKLRDRTAQLERVTEFANSTISLMIDAVQRGDSKQELLTLLAQVKAELDKE